MNDITAFVLAGGKSARMGRDKALLELGGRTLLERALALAGSVARRVWIVGEREKLAAFGAVIEDVYQACGPLGGIHAGLAKSTTELNLVLAVDLPFLNPDFLRYLIAEARATNATVTVPRAAGGWQPLCAVYRRKFVETAERSLREGKNKIDSLFSEIQLRVLEEEELLQAGFRADMFHNLNTPEQFDAAAVDCGGEATRDASTRDQEPVSGSH